ncbi:uncharacterized protein PV07_11142 [Cladophialophora immunda]|uniref:BAH domain-containing protein n=1 Tax=Cladophialophora immunda TaxID=569365 RepID=A0A0D2CH39_9EURO|nr:uncharacterized protein PV07_11142 [Cladophialophora immunda]KIW22894.1 hypothetical protein PV07_11142 [Cladophialophora immunda]OQU93836.1 BAH domain-containing protein [Cladophialophora immunda]
MSSETETEVYFSPPGVRDSDTEESTEDHDESPETQGTEMSGQMIGRKRTASEMEDDASAVADSYENQGTRQGSEVVYTNEPDPPVYTVICPLTPRRKRILEEENEDVTILRVYPEQLSYLAIDFAVKPGSSWDSLKRYKNAQLSERVGPQFTLGSFAYVNRHLPPQPAPSEDASEEEKLEYDKANFWVALVSEIKAEDQATVFARVFWLYWPDELPMGRQPYHGKRELVMSNHVDIIEAQTLTWTAEISHWNESDDSNKTQLGETYWRQTLDINKAAGDPRALSKLRKFCICGGYDNPELEMYQCLGCRTWNHEACLITAMEQRAWERFKKGTLTNESQEKGENGTSSRKPSKMTKRAFKLKLKGKKPWAGKLEGKISRVDKLGVDEFIHAATIRQLVPQGKDKINGPFGPVVWSMEMNCLRCNRPLN